MPDKQWYSNKDLFEEIMDLKSDMKETRAMIRKYNGLYDKVADVKKDTTNVRKEVDNIISVQQGKHSVGNAIKSWGGWVFGLASFIVLITKLL